MLWMIPSCRSWPIRSRSSTMASRWTCSCSRAFSIAMPAWTREDLDQRLVVLGELVGAGLVGEVQVADRATLDRDGHAQEAVHRRVIRREPVAPRIDGDVRDPERAVLPDDEAEEPVAPGQVPDPRPGLAVDPGGDEAFHDAVGVDDAEGRVSGPDERTDLVDDDLQDVLDPVQLRDRADCRVERTDDTAGRGNLPDPAHPSHGSRVPRTDRRSSGPVGPRLRAAWPMARRGSSARLWQWKPQ